MKKKLMLSLMLVLMGLSVFACGKSNLDYVRQNLSEWTKTYFFGEGENFYCSLSSGEREENYLLNGKSEKRISFALLSIFLNNGPQSNILKISLKIGDEVSEKELELNTLNKAYMIDLEKELAADAHVEVVYNSKTVKLENISKNFGINDQKALEIATRELEDKIVKMKSFTNLNAECYLSVLDKKANNFEGVFWCFTVINVNGGNYSVVISTADGSVLAKTN